MLIYVFFNFSKAYLKSAYVNGTEIFENIEYFDIFANNINEYYDKVYNNILSKGKGGRIEYYKIINKNEFKIEIIYNYRSNL